MLDARVELAVEPMEDAMDGTDGALEPGLYQDGDLVSASDGGKLGQVIDFWPSRDEPSILVVAGGDRLPELYVPVSAIGGFQPGQIYLSVTRDQALASGWATPPPGEPAAGPDSAN